MSKLEKKIDKSISFIKKYIDLIIENRQELQTEKSEKKRNKIIKNMNYNIGMVILYIKDLNKLNIKMENLKSNFTDIQLDTMNQILPNGFACEDMKIQEKRNYIISRHKKRLNELNEAKKENPPYDPSLPVKEKLKNKIYKCEKEVGWHLYNGADKESSTYEPAWNYKEHLDSSPEFTEEEKEIMRHCYKVAEEYNEYWEGKFDWLEGKVLGLIDEKGDKYIAIKLSKSVFPDMIKASYPVGTYTNVELMSISKEWTQEFIRFSLNEKEVQELMRMRLEIVSDSRKRRGIYCENDLYVQTTDDENVIVNEIMKSKVGIKKTVFTHLYTVSKEVYEWIQKLNDYTFEELGID